jgi:hypothetical protein
MNGWAGWVMSAIQAIQETQIVDHRRSWRGLKKMEMPSEK